MTDPRIPCALCGQYYDVTGPIHFCGQNLLPMFGLPSIQDEALAICLREYRRCERSCSRDGAPNCHYHVVNGQCEPGRRVLANRRQQERVNG